MTRAYVWLTGLLNREEGQGMVEYAMIIGLVSVGVLAVIGVLGGQINNIFQLITNGLDKVPK